MTATKKILYTVNNYDMFILVRTILHAYEVIWATGVGIAVRQIAFNRYNLYLTDYNLPDGTGFELAGIIRNEDIDTPILFVTGDKFLNESKAIEAGGQGLLLQSKPSFIDELLARVDSLMEKQNVLNF